jgi:hypothetical protein
MDDAIKYPDCEELLKLSLECYKSLRRKYPARTHWTSEFQLWLAALERLSGKDLRGILVGQPDQMSPAWVFSED